MDQDDSSIGLRPTAKPHTKDGKIKCEEQSKSTDNDQSSNLQKPARASRMRGDLFTTRLSKTRSLQMSERLGTSARRPRGRER